MTTFLAILFSLAALACIVPPLHYAGWSIPRAVGEYPKSFILAAALAGFALIAIIAETAQ